MTSTDHRSPSPGGWNLADVWERVAAEIPDELALHHGGRSFDWSDFDRRADALAATFLAHGAVEQDKVAQYLYNGPEYLETLFAAFKAGMVPVNTNYRYTADELVYLWDNADAVVVVFHGAFAETCAAVRLRLSSIRLWLWVDDGTGPCPEWAVPYSTAIDMASAESRVRGPWGRSGDHLMLLYTGGTTGMPKGVMWRQDDIFGALDAANKKRLPPTPDLEAAGRRIAGPGPRNLPAAPLMHGTGLFNAISNLMVGGSVTTLTGRRFEPVELLDTIATARINSMSIVGDAFARPILDALDAEPGRWDISSLRVIVSSGVMWSPETKRGLLRHNDRLIMVDSLGSSEAIGMATSTTTADSLAAADSSTAIGAPSASSTPAATFVLGPDTRVVTEDGRDVAPGSGEIGRVALRGHTPIGYYKDPDKSAATFQIIDGRRYSIPGDWAEVAADGTVRLLGRGSQCINTGGEKVYPEEVEEVLKTHPMVRDAAVVGVPDERFGQSITALVETTSGSAGITDVDELIAHVKQHLAGYKAPKRIVVIPSIGRAPNGKLDYKRLTAEAVASLADSG